MIYRFIDGNGTFRIKDPQKYNLYFPLTDSAGRLLSAIAPNLSGDIKRDNGHFLTLPAGSEDLRSSPLCRREIFIKADGRAIRLSRPAGDTLEAGFLYHQLTKKINGLKIEILNFIPNDLPVEVMRVRIKNVSNRSIRICPVSFFPLYGRSEKNLRDHRHVSSLLNRIKLDKFGISLVPTMIFDEKGHKLNRAIYFCKGFEGKAVPPQGQYPTLDRFYGSGDIFRPDAVFADARTLTSKTPDCDGKEACAAFRFSGKLLAPGRQAEYVFLLGIAESESSIKGYFSRLNSPDKVEAAFERTRAYWRKYLTGITFDSGDRDRNGWLSWVKFQPTLRKLFGCSFLPHFDYGKGGRGWRDLWQDALAILLAEPEKAREIITGSFAGVRLDGSNATIIAADNSFLADRNKINRVWMDHGVWPFLTTRNYINRTGDLGLLLENQTYFRDHQLERAGVIDRDFCQNDFLQRDKNGKIFRGSLLEHILVENLVQFFNVGRHNIVRLENADWNDGLDMAAHNGEGAAFSFMYAHNLKEICVLLNSLKPGRRKVAVFKELKALLDTLGKPVDYNDYKAKQKRLGDYYRSIRNISGDKIEIGLEDLISDLEAKSRHMSAWLGKKEWLPEGFFNGYYDDRGLRVEGKRPGAVNMMLTSQVFAVLSGVASGDQVKLVWRAVNKYLKDKEFGGIRLNTDLKDPHLALGRAYGFSYGDKENGAFFSHMCVMLANALYKRFFISQGREVLDSVYRMAVSDRSAIPPVLPEYFNSQGKGLYLYLTGSASWYIYTLFEEALGIKFALGDILLEPKLLPGDFASRRIVTEFSLRDKRVEVVYQLSGIPRGNNRLNMKKVVIAGKTIPSSAGSCLIKTSLLKSRNNLIAVTLG